MAETPLQAPAPPPARRLSRPALGLALLVIVLFVTSAALIITAPGPRIPRAAEPNPKDQKPAQAAFLNNPPRRQLPQTTQTPPDAERIEELLRAARQAPPPSGSGPLSFVPTGPEPGSLPAAPVPPEGSPGGVGAPPVGAYRPYLFPSSPRPAFSEPAGKPSWQAAFASSLLASSAPDPAPGVPQPPSFTPPPVPSLRGGEESGKGRPEPLPTEPQRALLSSPGKLLKPRTLRAGTVLNAILLTALSTDFPGDAVAHLTTDVYTPDGKLVLPRGTRLVGSYKNRVALGESRLAIAWDRLLVGGRSYEIPGLPSTSPDGAAGLPAEVNNHTGLVFGRAALLSLISAGSQLGQPRQSRLGPSLGTGEVATGSVSQQLSQAATEYLNRAVNVAPTLFLPAGARLTVLLPYDLELTEEAER
jgi:type IV secretory pathway VirB10-like protein